MFCYCQIFISQHINEIVQGNNTNRLCSSEMSQQWFGNNQKKAPETVSHYISGWLVS